MAEPRHDEKQAESRREKASQQSSAARDNIRSMTDVGSQIAGSAADMSHRAAQTGVEMLDRNKEAAQQLWEQAADLASHLARQWTDQLGRTLGISGENAESVAKRSSHSFDALLQSGDVISSTSRELSREWFGTARRMVDATVGRSDKIAACRTPNDLWAMQLEMMREGMETALQGAKRFSEISAKAAADATQKRSEVTKRAA